MLGHVSDPAELLQTAANCWTNQPIGRAVSLEQIELWRPELCFLGQPNSCKLLDKSAGIKAVLPEQITESRPDGMPEWGRAAAERACSGSA